MHADHFRRLYAYTAWANDRILATIRGLTGEQFTRPVLSSFSSIRDTLAHVVFAEWLWLRRWNGESPTALPPWAAGASLETLESTLRELEAERRTFLESITDEVLEKDLSYRNLAGESFTRRFSDLL